MDRGLCNRHRSFKTRESVEPHDDRLPPEPAPADKLAEFKLQFSAAAYRRICGEFLSSTPGLVAAIDSAVRNNQAEQVASLAHQLKGSMGTIGALRLSDLAHRLEVSRAPGPMRQELMDEILREYARVRAIIESDLGGPA